LQPTQGAARFHSLRSYHQVQKWLELDKDPTEWGWIRSQRGLSPLKTMRDPAPVTILKLISCGCIKGCGNACGCRKAGLKCSILCAFCIGQILQLDETMTMILNDQMTGEAMMREIT
jgi:hypothetical protein